MRAFSIFEVAAHEGSPFLMAQFLEADMTSLPPDYFLAPESQPDLRSCAPWNVILCDT
jgi:hypothetical protein